MHKIYQIQKEYRVNELVEVQARTRREAKKLAPLTKGVRDDEPILYRCRILNWKEAKVPAPKKTPLNDATKKPSKSKGKLVLQWGGPKKQSVELPAKVVETILSWRDEHLTKNDIAN